jgi:hypothetical protein
VQKVPRLIMPRVPWAGVEGARTGAEELRFMVEKLGSVERLLEPLTNLLESCKRGADGGLRSSNELVPVLRPDKRVQAERY